MGCKQSTAVKVRPFESGDGKGLKKTASEADHIEADIEDRTRKNDKRNKNQKLLGSSGSLGGGNGQDSDRGGSAGSKKSNDSGLDLGEDNHGFITENSDPNKVREIEEGFKEREDLDLAVTGVTLPTRNSAKDKARLEESMILQKLREEGLISKTTAEKSGSVSFEVVDMTSGAKLPALPPIKLAKLERRRKKKRTLTEEEIKEKLERAEERRKRKEQARLDKIKEMDKGDQTAALESFQDYVKKKEVQTIQKMETVLGKKEQRLMEIKEKQLERERKREEVRRRKKERMALQMNQENTGEIIMDPSELLEREETPMVPE